jgi:hypothetical protein
VSGSTFGPRSILPGLLYMEAQVGRKYKGHWLFSWSLEGSFAHNQSSHRSSSAYSFCPYCQSCRTQVVEQIFQHISQLWWSHTTWRSLPKLF